MSKLSCEDHGVANCPKCYPDEGGVDLKLYQDVITSAEPISIITRPVYHCPKHGNTKDKVMSFWKNDKAIKHFCTHCIMEKFEELGITPMEEVS